MITIVTEGAVHPKFLTASDVSNMRADIPVKNAKIDDLMSELAGKMGIDEKVPWENIDDPILVDAAAGISGISNVESFADSQSQQSAPSIWIIKKLLAQTTVPPTRTINGKPLTSDITFDVTDFDIYTKAEILAKFDTPVTPDTIMELGDRLEKLGDNTEVPDHVLVDVKKDGNDWYGVFRPIIAILQDGSRHTVTFS